MSIIRIHPSSKIPSSDQYGLGYDKEKKPEYSFFTKQDERSYVVALKKKESKKTASPLQRTYMIPRRPMSSRYQQIFLCHFYFCNNFGHKALNCKAYGKVQDYKKNFRKTKSSHQRDQKEFFGYFHCCHKFGHKAIDCITKGKDQSPRRKQDKHIR